MIKIRKLICIILVVCLSSALVLTGCDSSKETAGNQTQKDGSQTAAGQDNNGQADNKKEVVWPLWEEKPGTGLFYTPEEVAVWKKRIEKGPYKEPGDVSINSPGDWARIVESANTFLLKTAAGRVTKKTEAGKSHINIADAAFVYLLTGNKEMFEAVKGELLAQTAEPGARISTWGLELEDGFLSVSWVIRLLTAYDFIKEGLTEAERKQLDDWFCDAGSVFAYNVNNALEMIFPNRLKEDYSVRGRVALSGNMKDVYTHINADGSKGNQVSFLSTWYNNRKSILVEAAALIGIFLRDRDMIGQGKLFVKEMLMFGTYPDGTMGEYERNGNYDVPQQGMIYSTTNIQACILIADALARKGDFELYEYTTSEGLHGTEGGSKSIRLLVENYNKQTAGTVERYYEKVEEANRIDIEDLDGGEYGVQKFAHNTWFAVGNRYWKDEFFKSVYKREVGPQYPENPASVAGNTPVWKGDSGQFPGILFMYGMMEDEASPYPTAIEPISAPYNAVEYPGGMWYSSEYFSKGTYRLNSVSNASQQTIEFDVLTSNDAFDGVSAWDATIGFTGSSVKAENYTDLPVIIRFNGGMSIDARNGDKHESLVKVGYTKNRKYHFKIAVNLTAGIFDVWVTPDGNPETKIAEGYSFRTDAPAIDDIGQITLHDFFEKGFKVRNLTVY